MLSWWRVGLSGQWMCRPTRSKLNFTFENLSNSQISIPQLSVLSPGFHFEICRTDALATQQQTQKLLSHMHSFHRYLFPLFIFFVIIWWLHEKDKKVGEGNQKKFFSSSNQNGEAKRERVARMRRARSMPKMDDQEVPDSMSISIKYKICLHLKPQSLQYFCAIVCYSDTLQWPKRWDRAK